MCQSLRLCNGGKSSTILKTIGATRPKLQTRSMERTIKNGKKTKNLLNNLFWITYRFCRKRLQIGVPKINKYPLKKMMAKRSRRHIRNHRGKRRKLPKSKRHQRPKRFIPIPKILLITWMKRANCLLEEAIQRTWFHKYRWALKTKSKTRLAFKHPLLIRINLALIANILSTT